MKSMPRKEARHISLALFASEGLLAHPRSVLNEKNFPRIWRLLCGHFSISITNKSVGINMKSVPRKEARHILLLLSALQGLLACPWSVPCEKILPCIWQLLCAHFSKSVTSKLIGIKMKSVPRMEAWHILLALSASQGLLAYPRSFPSEKNFPPPMAVAQGLLARPWSDLSEKKFSPHMAVPLCSLFKICY